MDDNESLFVPIPLWALQTVASISDRTGMMLILTGRYLEQWVEVVDPSGRRAWATLLPHGFVLSSAGAWN